VVAAAERHKTNTQQIQQNITKYHSRLLQQRTPHKTTQDNITLPTSPSLTSSKVGESTTKYVRVVLIVRWKEHGPYLGLDIFNLSLNELEVCLTILVVAPILVFHGIQLIDY